MVDDGRIEYIKDSLDKLHDKVDKVYLDADNRLKKLELDKAHQKGMMRALSVVSGIIGSALTLIVSYITFHKD